MSQQFQVVVADPPWCMRDSLRMSSVKRGASSNYSTMTTEQIKKLPVKDICDPSGAILCLWVPSSLLQDGLDVMRAWDFTQKTSYIWVKTKKESDKIKDCLSFGMGRTFRACHEICLIGVNNTKIYQKLSNKSQRSVSFARNMKHSSKPEALQNSLDIMFPFPKDGSINRIEIFGRRLRPNWTIIGNESPSTFGEDISISLSKLM